MIKLSIILPVYNEKPTISKLLEQVFNSDVGKLKKEIIIVEGNSTDGTRDVVKKYENRKDVKVIYEKKPEGKGAAIRKALGHVTGDIILIQDGDLEYKTTEYKNVLAPIIKQNVPIVYGSRRLTHPRFWQYRNVAGRNIYLFFLNLGGAFYTTLFNILYGTKFTDVATMFKVFRADVLKSVKFKTNGFDTEWEITAKLAKKGYKFYEVPVSYQSRLPEQGKKIKFFRDGFKVMFAIIRFRFCD
ncbi:glycosyltransferase family 2 protein [Candidatus Woesearchaeota archaeon]|nr:glycosyltransferase family 2 protein [Candidatus Woesearchaeota archaeon]